MQEVERLSIRNIRMIHMIEPTNMAERMHNVDVYKRVIPVNMPILIDDMNNTMMTAYGGYPNKAYVIGPDGKITFYQTWERYPGLETAYAAALATVGVADRNMEKQVKENISVIWRAPRGFSISVPTKNPYHVSLFNATGTRILSEHVSGKRMHYIDRSVGAGYYIFRIVSKNKKTHTIPAVVVK
jgi:hypothetical protein